MLFNVSGDDWELEARPPAYQLPRKKKVKEIGKRIKAALKASWAKPLNEVISTVNAVIRGWVNYFRIGNSNRTFCKVRNYIEKKVRRFVMRRKKLKGFGWKRVYASYYVTNCLQNRDISIFRLILCDKCTIFCHIWKQRASHLQ